MMKENSVVVAPLFMGNPALTAFEQELSGEQANHQSLGPMGIAETSANAGQIPSFKKKKPILKFVFTGSVGSGKTTAIANLSETSYFSTEAKPSEQDVMAQKQTTTVAMDYGVIKTLDGHDKFYLYGTPGQRRFDFMTPILTRDAAGLIIIINNTHNNPLDDLYYYLELNKSFLRNNPAVIGITHYDKCCRPSVEDYLNILKKRGVPWPVIHVDAREQDDMLLLLDTLIMMVEFI